MSQNLRSPLTGFGAFESWRALILHRAHSNVDAIMHQCARIGIEAVQCWPEITCSETISAFNVLLFDADMGYDGQFPWEPANAPVPTIALIGSEAPGRISWAMNQGADAQLLKPIGSSGLYSALVIASHNFARRHTLSAEISGLRQSLNRREILAEATAYLMISANLPAKAAYQKLRLLAMEQRVTIEQAAMLVVKSYEETGHNSERA